MAYHEVNFDGLIGPTHNYAGLSFGNIASAKNAGEIANPREAALQGLSKMRALVDLGLVQGFLPPLVRPDMQMLRSLGFSGSDENVIKKAGTVAPQFLAYAFSASSMWTANAATVAPSLDTSDQRVHFTPANLAANFHRAIEVDQTAQNLAQIFADQKYFCHHPKLPGGVHFGDEGAANHGRLAAKHDDPGIHLFVYGEDGTKFPARQKLCASQAVARNHGLTDENSFFLKQSTIALDAGAFHNDVVGVANENVIFLHENSFEDQQAALDQLKRKAPFVEIVQANTSDVPIEDAISSYLFNSQLLSLPDGAMGLVLPGEAAENSCTNKFIERVREENNPINQIIFKDVRESMRNGGGPACLRLRVLLSDDELAAVNQHFILDYKKIDRLERWVNEYYRDRLHPDELSDPEFLVEVLSAIEILYRELGLAFKSA